MFLRGGEGGTTKSRSPFFIMSPERVDQCVQSLLDDPNFKPKEGKTREESAYALCNWLYQQGKLKMVGEKVEITIDKMCTGPFKVVLPITAAKRQVVEKAEGGEEVQLWLHVEASGKERDSDGDRFSEAGLQKLVEYAEKTPRLNLLDGHYKDLLAAVLGDIHNPHLTKEKHFAFDVLLNSETNPFAVQLFNDVLAGKRHGASIAGVVHDAEIEEYGEGEFGQIFNDVELLEVSRTSWPSYRDSFITLLANKVGKLPEAEFEAVMKRRDELVKIRTDGGEDEMLVKTADGGVEEWGENEAGDLIVKIISPHGWDEKFGVSDIPWSDVEDRTKPCQYAIVEENEDGTFSTSKSGYPHHMPDCNTINRGGVIAAAGRLVQALKSNVPAIETPPVVSLVSERIGRDWLLVKQENGFTTDELKYAANHIIRHYRQDIDEEPPENLVDVAKTYDDEKKEIIELIKGLVRMIEKSPQIEEVIMTKDNEVVETPVEEQEFTEEQAETVTETETIEAEPAEKQEAEEEMPEVIGEPEVAEEEESLLGKVVDARLLASKFGELIYAMQEMVGNAIQEKELDTALKVLEDFSVMSRDVLTQLVATQATGEVALSFLGPIESRIELATGRLTKSRVGRVDEAIDSLVEELVGLRELMKNADTTDDTVVLEAVKGAEEKSEHVAEFEKRLDAMESKRKDELETLARTLAEPQREQPPTEEPEPIELSEDEKRTMTLRRFGKSMGFEK